MLQSKSVFLLAAITILVTACTKSITPEEWERKKSQWAAEVASYPASTYTTAGLRKRYSGATFLDYNVQHGTQVEYMAPNGVSYLWYPGNDRIVTGRWKVEPPRAGSKYAKLCWKYGRNTYNPATRTRGGTFNCVPANRHILAEEEYTLGDPLKLSSGKVPFVLKPKREYSLVKIGKKLGIPIALLH